MINAKEEFLKHVGYRKVLCATVSHRDLINTDYKLNVEHSYKEYDKFIESLDFEYYPGYGAQELFGVIWYIDGTWSTRGEYDGSEWWENHLRPQIPKDLNPEWVEPTHIR
jgi:hypothetical protein